MAFETVTEVPGNKGGREAPKEFIPTPNRIAQFLELKTDEVEAQMKTREGCNTLYYQLLVHEDVLRRDHKNFNPESLRRQMDYSRQALESKGRYMQEIRSPEKRGIFGRAWETIKAFPRKHPYVTAALAATAVIGAIAAGIYFSGYWGTLMAASGLKKWAGNAAEKVGGFATDTAEKVGGFGTNAVDTAKDAMSGVADKVGEFIPEVPTSLPPTEPGPIGSLQEAQNILDGLK